MHVTFALFADAANVSQEGKLNILGVFDALQVTTLPALHARAHLVVRLKGTRSDAGSHVVELRWLNPRGEMLWSSTGQIDIGAPPVDVSGMDLPMIASIDLPLDHAGTYAMEIGIDAQPHASVNLQVRSQSDPGVMMAPAGAMFS
ncbi:MAG: hypothetical protein ABJD07_02130 [Gemmatimonadaceae bacterium]